MEESLPRPRTIDKLSLPPTPALPCRRGWSSIFLRRSRTVPMTADEIARRSASNRIVCGLLLWGWLRQVY